MKKSDNSPVLGHSNGHGTSGDIPYSGYFSRGVYFEGYISRISRKGPSSPTLKPSNLIITPRAHARARGYVIGRGVYYILYVCKTFFYLSKYSLSDAHFSTGRLLFEFNRFQAAPEVFVASANPVSLPSGYRVSIVRNTNIDQIETTPLRYTVEHAVCNMQQCQK